MVKVNIMRSLMPKYLMLDMYHSIVDTKHTEFLNRVRSNMIPLAVVGDNNNSVKASKILILRKVPTLRYRTPK